MSNTVDARAMRFGALISTIVLGLSILLGPDLGLVPLALQTLVFALAAVMGLHTQPYVVIFHRYVENRLASGPQPEPTHPPRFAQGLGLVLAILGLLAGVVGASLVFYLVVGLAVIASGLNAAFEYCIGCKLYTRLMSIGDTPTIELTDDARTEDSVRH